MKEEGEAAAMLAEEEGQGRVELAEESLFASHNPHTIHNATQSDLSEESAVEQQNSSFICQ
jgi:hypothetical protein